METTHYISYKETITPIQVTNIEGRLTTLLSELAPIFPEIRTPIRTMELANLDFIWDGNTITVTDRYPADLTPTELDYLHRITQAEAGGEDIMGRILVVNVIMNRLKSTSRDFKNVNTIKEVIKQPKQFEPMRNGAFKRAIPSKGTIEAVKRALEGEDYSQGALFFRSIRGLKGSWHKENLRHLFTHGNHAFFIP